jgi:probable FeS assembly SUF system protein SufT
MAAFNARENRIVATVRDCPARRVPTGEPVTIPADTFVTITQSLGGNYTLVYGGNMLRVDGTDADALGLEKQQLDIRDRGDGRIHEDQVWQALDTIYDPEIPVSLRSLGLIYKLAIDQDSKTVTIDMTLTAPGCGMGPVLMGDVEYRVAQVPGVAKVVVNLVFDPPWSRDMMSEEAQLETGLFY